MSENKEIYVCIRDSDGEIRCAATRDEEAIKNLLDREFKDIILVDMDVDGDLKIKASGSLTKSDLEGLIKELKKI